MIPSPSCPCCNAPLEAEEHVLFGCPATGSIDWLLSLKDAWREAASPPSESCDPPPDAWLTSHRMPLVAALILRDTHLYLKLPTSSALQFLSRLHHALAGRTAELLRRREDLKAAASSSSSTAPALLHPCPLPPERQLPTSTLRRLEVDSRVAVASSAPSSSGIPSGGDARRRWLRAELLSLLRRDTDPCPCPPGTIALVFLEWFEHSTHEPFSECRDAPFTSRLRALSRVLSNLSREKPFDPPLSSVTHRSMVCWNRHPRRHVDVAAWRLRVERAESAVSRPSLQIDLGSVDAGLPDWIRRHPHLSPTEVDQGESGMALLILWEVDHQRSFPSRAASESKAILASFTKRLQHQVSRDSEL